MLMKSKFEKIMIIILWFLILITLRLVFPIEKMDFEVKLQLCIATTIIVFILYYLYLKIRNNIIVNKINSYLLCNDFNSCISYINKCIESHKKVFWLRFKKVVILAMMGEYAEFKSLATEIKKDSRIYKKDYLCVIQKYELLYDYLCGKDVLNIDISLSSNSFLDRILYLIFKTKKMLPQDRISYALDIYNTPYYLYKVIAAIILSIEYSNINDVENAKLFLLKATEYAPSKEINYFIENLCLR